MKTERGSLTTIMFWIALVSLVLGAAVRVVVSMDDLWFDEIWTLDLIRENVSSPADVFTHFKHSNNHHLISLWMWLVGPEAWAPIFRLPSVLASLGTIVVAGLIAGRRGRLESLLAVILTSWSYLLIHFGTEARGYSAAIFCALLAWYAALCFEQQPLWRWAGVGWAAIVLGFLAHLEFAVCGAGVAVWALFRLLRRRQTPRESVTKLLRFFLVPVGLALFFYFGSIRDMKVGGGPPYDLAALLVKAASYMVGGPGDGVGADVSALLAAASICAALFWLMRRRDDQWLFYAFVIAIPLALIAIKRPEQLYVRYFMISVMVALLLFAQALGALLRGGRLGLGIGLALLALYGVGNSINTANLLRYGRGQYQAALRFMEEQSRGRDLVVTSDHDFRNGPLVKYYQRYLDRPAAASYLDATALKNEYVASGGQPYGAEWMIVHCFQLPRQPERIIGDVYGHLYELVCVYRYSDLSGSHWLLYHNLNRPAVQPTTPLLR
jgi:hypothetical protein